MKVTRKVFIGSYVCIFLLALFCFASCKKKNTKENSYKFFNYQEQEWKTMSQQHLIGEINYKATEVPNEYYLLKNLNKEKNINAISKSLKNERVIEIEFEHSNQTDLLKKEYTNLGYKRAVEYMAFKIVKDFKVVTSSNDTIMCSGVNFERTFKVAPYKKIILYFNNIDAKENIKLIYEDYLFGNGILKFNFSEIPIKL
jgi:hypothetical protein